MGRAGGAIGSVMSFCMWNVASVFGNTANVLMFRQLDFILNAIMTNIYFTFMQRMFFNHSRIKRFEQKYFLFKRMNEL